MSRKIDPKFIDSQMTTDTELAAEASIRAAADAEYDSRLDVMDIIDSTSQVTVFENNSTVFADACPGIQDPNHREGWYFKNLGPVGDGTKNKINWYFFDGQTENISLSNLSAYAIITLDSLVSKPHFSVYTTMTGSPGNAGTWYRSRVVYITTGTMVAGVKYLIYFGQDPKVHPELPRVQMEKAANCVGPQAGEERVLTMALGSDSGAAIGNCIFISEAVGIYSPNIKRKISLKIRKASQTDLSAEILARQNATKSYDISSSTPFSTTLTNTYEQVTDFVFTPAAGKYVILVDSSAVSTDLNSDNFMILYKNSTAISTTEKSKQTLIANHKLDLSTLCVVEFSGSEQLRMYVKTTAGTLTINSRTMIALRLN